MEEDFILARVIALILTEMRQPDRHTVAVIMERAQIKRGPWSVPSWRAVSVVERAERKERREERHETPPTI